MSGATTTSFVYDLANDVLSESYTGGFLGGLTVTNQFDADLRRTNMALLNGATTLCRTTNGYDNASRLATVSDGTNVATYSYLANSSLVGQITFAQSGTTAMTTSKQYDYLNRLSSIASTPSNSFAYQYNSANQRTMAGLYDSSYWRYGYDALGQVTLGNKYWVDETPVAGQQFDYTFDTIGNRTQIEAGGDQNAANLRVAGYTNNTLNQITSRGVPAAVDVMGDGLATNGVTVNGLTAYRKNEYFRQQLSVTNTSAAVWDSVTVVATGQTSVTGHAYVPKAPEDYTYDVDGNLLSDGRWNYTWDGENRLVSMTSLSTAPSGSQLQLLFTYDYMGRRIQKIVSTNNGSSYIGEYTNKYAYDGWNCVAILNPSLVLSNSFMWGSDLSGTIQGAGGVGGLVKVAYYGAATTNCFVAYDGNGNVSALINAADGTTSATYEYGPFGELLRATGPMAKLNPKRFQTATDDDETDLLYYGYRYYNPSTGRWLSRDPILEKGGLNLYVFNNNQPISKYDLLGLLTKTIRDGMWSQANVSSTPVWAPAGQTTYAGLIGTNFLRYAWIDADSQDTMQNYDPALYNWVTSHYSWNQGSLQEFNSAGYVGAGIAIEYVPSACGIKNGKASWNQVKIGRLWNSHDVSVSGNFFVDSPGGLISRMFKTRSQTFQLQMLFNGSVVATYTWSYSVNPTSSSPKPGDLAPQVTLTTPF